MANMGSQCVTLHIYSPFTTVLTIHHTKLRTILSCPGVQFQYIFPGDDPNSSKKKG